jgi:hypothetical protein
MLHPTLAGHLPLQDMIAQTIDSARTKLAAAEEKEKKKENPFSKHEKGESKAEEKKEEEGKEKKSSAILNISDPEEMDKLASALDEMGDDFIKESDSIENGGESHQGGQQLATASPVGGKQNYKKDSAHHQVPTSTGLEAKKETGSAATANPDTQHKPPVPLTSSYPKKGVLKTAEACTCKDGKKDPKCCVHGEKEKKSSVELLQGALEKMAFSVTGEGHKLDAESYKADAEAAHKKTQAHEDYKGKRPGTTGLATAADLTIGGGIGGKASYLHRIGNRLTNRHMDYAAKKHEKDRNAYNPFGGFLTKSRQEEKHPIKSKEKKSEAETSPVDFILSKVAEFHGGGETLDSAAQQGPKPQAAPGRQLIANNQAPVSATKREAKAPRKAELAQVLTEPALTKSTDSKVQDNLRNASKGGVKIAEAAKEALQKIAADPNDPRHEALKKAIADRKAGKDGDEKKEGKDEEKKS